ncbi:MAG TPA: lmo0937 family membrane protein [Candidatus Acidoferrum sp.]|nr:lmo0937 family membrane protein [Candidatus Acidoferrum sp.]
MIWTLVVLLFVFWLVGLVAHVGGGLIHLLLVIAIIVAAVNLPTGRRSAV